MSGLGYVAAVAAQALRMEATPPVDPPDPDPEPDPPDELEAPILEAFQEITAATSTLTAAAVGPPANSRLIAVALTRNGTADRTHAVPSSSGLSLASGWALVGSRNINPGGTTNLRVSIWEAIAGATPGAGDVSTTTNANIAEGFFAVLSIKGGGARLTQGIADNASGTTLVLPMADSSTPPANSVALFAFVNNGTGGSGIAASGFTMLEDLTKALTNGRYGVGYNLGSPPAEWTITGAQNNSGKVAVGVIYEEAT